MSKLIAKNVNVLQELKAHNNDITCVEFGENALLVTGSSDKTVRVWKWKVGSGFVEDDVVSPLIGHKYSVTCVKISPQGAVLASSSADGTIILWELSTGDKTNTLYQENGEAVRSCCFSPDGALIAASDDSGAVCIWGQQKQLIRVLRYHEETVYTVVFSSDSNILLTGCNMGMIRMITVNWENESNSFRKRDSCNDFSCGIDNAHDLGVMSADFCKLIHVDPTDMETIIYSAVTCGNDQCIKIWRIFCLKSRENSNNSRLIPNSIGEHESGTSIIYNTSIMNTECVLVIPAHGCSVTCVRFNFRGTYLISCGMDKAVKIWDLYGECLKTLVEHSRYVNCVAINIDSTIIASGSNDRSVILWDLSGSLALDSHLSGPRSIVFNLAVSDIEIPLELICPITHEIMSNPVKAEDGFTYERSAILNWFDRGKTTSPMTNEEFKVLEFDDNVEIKAKIDEFLQSLDFDAFV